jgi:hypothetical protein
LDVAASPQDYDIAAIMGGLYGDGIIALKGAFTPEWADRLAEDVWAVWDQVKDKPGGALPRGPQRFYVEVAPEQIRGFVEISTHPWFVAVCEAVLGKDYRIVEVGFDIPFRGAEDQPWHRDFLAPAATLEGRRLNSLAFNLTCIDTRPEHGPFEVAPGTQWDEIPGARDGMFPDRSSWSRYEERAQRKMPQRGDMGARSALTIHRGTANRSDEPRPVLVVGVDAPDATNAHHHDLQVTRGYLEALPARVRDHLTCRVVDRLEMIEQHHVIDGLLAPIH